MAIVGFIVKGDRSSHGGHVVECTSRRSIDGLLVARVGDPVWCPRCNRMTKIVTSRFPQITDNGVPSAFDLDTTDCGAVLYSRHNNHAGYGSDDAHASSPPTAKAAAPAPRRTGEATRVQEHFVLCRDGTGQALAGVKYTLRTAGGRVIEGETDEHGRTGVVWTDRPEGMQLVLGSTDDAGDDPYHYSETITEAI
jgi:uncharacterized Zn-binding protein involved in type VI secretion